MSDVEQRSTASGAHLIYGGQQVFSPNTKAVEVSRIQSKRDTQADFLDLKYTQYRSIANRHLHNLRKKIIITIFFFPPHILKAWKHHRWTDAMATKSLASQAIHKAINDQV